MGINNNDIANWALRLKGNWKKGVHLLDSIMQVPATANEFIDDGSGLLCIYGVKDRNSQELANVIEKHGYGDKAITRYLNIRFSWSRANIAAIVASSTDMATIAASSTAMAAVAASSTAMAAIIANATARNAISASTVAKTALRNSPLKVTKTLTTNAWATTTTGKGWLIDYYQPTNPGGSVGWTIDGTLKAITATGTTAVDTWALTSSSIYWHYTNSWATYIPIT